MAETARAARAEGAPVIMGAPNVLRGGSHLRGLGTADMVADGACSVLASDYYYPALLHAPFRLAAAGVTDLPAAWALASAGAAEAVGLTDRGHIAEGLRADVVLVDTPAPDLPAVMAVLCAGAPALRLG